MGLSKTKFVTFEKIFLSKLKRSDSENHKAHFSDRALDLAMNQTQTNCSFLCTAIVVKSCYICSLSRVVTNLGIPTDVPEECVPVAKQVCKVKALNHWNDE